MGVYQQGTPIEITDTFSVDGVETNPTLVTYTVLGPDGVTTVYLSGGAQVTNPTVGTFILSLDPPASPGEYLYDVDATGVVVASRAGSFTVLPDATGDGVAWAVQGPCSPWADAQDVWNCCGQPTTTIGEGTMTITCPVDMSQFAFEASQLLYELSGRRFAGHCDRTVVACEGRSCSWCGFQVLSRGHIVGPWDWGYWPYWGDCWLWPCGHPSLIKLAGYPVREITEVVIDGAPLVPGDYQLLADRRHIMRLGGQRWPFCDVLSRAGTEGDNTITYKYGEDPPLTGVHAAAQLGCELYKQCASIPCALPPGTTRSTRQGVTIERPEFINWAFQPRQTVRSPRGWQTGMAAVDAFLNSFNPSGVPRRPTFWSPSARNRYATKWA